MHSYLDTCSVEYFSSLCVREELAIATEDGSLTRLRWNGTVNTKLSFKFSDVTVAADFQQSRGKLSQ